MKRREFITLVGSTVAMWPLAARARQRDQMRRIAVLLRVAQDDPDAQRDLQSFRKGLWQLGWAAGSNILIEYRYASADPAQMQSYAAELVGLPAEVVLAGGSLALAALRQETRTTPIVFVRVADPVSQGFVASLAHDIRSGCCCRPPIRVARAPSGNSEDHAARPGRPGRLAAVR